MRVLIKSKRMPRNAEEAVLLRRRNSLDKVNSNDRKQGTKYTSQRLKKAPQSEHHTSITLEHSKNTQFDEAYEAYNVRSVQRDIRYEGLQIVDLLTANVPTQGSCPPASYHRNKA